MLGGYSLEGQFLCQSQNEIWRFFGSKIGTEDLFGHEQYNLFDLKSKHSNGLAQKPLA
jgi:hypothetical protein